MILVPRTHVRFSLKIKLIARFVNGNTEIVIKHIKNLVEVTNFKSTLHR